VAGQERDYACPDQITSSGLHNFIIQVTDHALRLAQDPDTALAEGNPNYRFLIDYDAVELKRGLLAATLMYQQESLGSMQDNSLITQIGFVIVLLIIVGQYFFLGIRIEMLMKKHGHVQDIIVRFLKLDDEFVQKQQSRQRQVFVPSIRLCPAHSWFGRCAFSIPSKPASVCLQAARQIRPIQNEGGECGLNAQLKWSNHTVRRQAPRHLWYFDCHEA
jgi:hypothetical protein